MPPQPSRPPAFALLAAALCLYALVPCAQAQCNKRCSFRFCMPGRNQKLPSRTASLTLRPPNVAAYPFVCRKGLSLGRIRRTKEAIVSSDKLAPTRISKWIPAGFSRKTRPFSKRYFSITDIPLARDAQSVVRSNANGFEALDGICVVIPIKIYEVKRGKRTRTVRGRAKDCVSFKAVSPELVIDLTWSDAEDLDLTVEGPRRGQVTNAEDIESDCRGGQETVTFKNAEAGEYTVSYGFHHNHSTPTIFERRDINSFSVAERYHWGFPYCSVQRNGEVVEKPFPSPPAIAQRMPFRYKVSVSYGGRNIVDREGEDFINGFGALGTISIRCSRSQSRLTCVES